MARPMHHISALARAAGQRTGFEQVANTTSPPEGVGFIKDHDRGGYGVKKGRDEAVLGLYRRPPDPNLPTPTMYEEGKGAAGVSMSIKLGH